MWRYVLVLALLLPAVLLKAHLGFGGGKGPVVVTESTLPDKPAGWGSDIQALTDEELSMLQSPAAAQRIYRNSMGEVVQVLLLQVDNTQNAHDPRICMNGSGY